MSMDNNAKMATLPKETYGFNIIPLKNPADIFADIKKLVLKLMSKLKTTRMSKTTLKNKVRGLPLTRKLTRKPQLSKQH